MKISAKLTVVMLITVLMATTALGGKRDRKLSVGAYLSSAKIEILSGEMERYKTAEAYLDSLFLNYGPHAEAIHLMGQIMVDYLAQTPDPEQRLVYARKMVAYNDSLHLCCENKDVKKKHRKDCDKYIALSDSIIVQHWREAYNAGIGQLNQIDEIKIELAAAEDSSMMAMLQSDLDANVDSAVTKLQMATILDPEDHRSYIGIGSAFEKVNENEKAIEWLTRGLDQVRSRGDDVPPDTLAVSTLLFSLAYNNIQLDRFCDAIPYFKEYVDLNPDDTLTMYNLSACYNNCKFFDSAAMVNQQILQYAPNNREALVSLGFYHNQHARDASDSASAYRDAENTAKVEEWMAQRRQAFDSARVYFERAVEAHPDDLQALEQYGTVTALTEDYNEAAKSFGRLAELKPERSEYWRSWGDFSVRLKDFDNAIVAYEKTVELDPQDAETWDRLASLYKEKGMAEKQKAAAAKVKALRP